MDQTLTLAPTNAPRRFRAPDGTILTPPDDWALLPPGDAGLTRRVKDAGPSWTVIEMRGRKEASRAASKRPGGEDVEAAKRNLEAERARTGVRTPQRGRRPAARRTAGSLCRGVRGRGKRRSSTSPRLSPDRRGLNWRPQR